MKEDIKMAQKELNELKEQSKNMNSNFDLGKTFRNIIYF